MKITSIQVEDHYSLNYSRDFVWEKLNDPEILAACIRGCAQLDRESSRRYTAVIRARVGEVKKDFRVDLNVEDALAPAEYSLSTVVGAGVFGNVNGLADVKLDVIGPQQTRLVYLATIEGRGLIGKTLPFIESAARNRVREFFDRFVEHLDT